jgi:hypothetical protein
MIPPSVALLASEGIVDAASVEGAAAGGGVWDAIMNAQIPLPIKESSCISKATYRIRDGALVVYFHRGETAEYPEVDAATVIAFVKANSPGTFYNLHLRGRA